MQTRRFLAIPAAALLVLALGAPAALAQDSHARSRSDRAPQSQSRDHDNNRARQAEHRSNDGRADRSPQRDVNRDQNWNGDRDWDRNRVIIPRTVVPRAVPRYDVRSNVWVAPRLAPRAVIITPRPFYRYQPRTTFSFGLFIGTRAPYRWAAVPRVYGYAAVPGEAYGAVSLDFGPADAAVYVDGVYVGRVDEFSDGVHALALVIGRHRIDLSAPGYEPMAFYVDVAPGALIPYQGGLQPLGY